MEVIGTKPSPMWDCPKHGISQSEEATCWCPDHPDYLKFWSKRPPSDNPTTEEK